MTSIVFDPLALEPGLSGKTAIVTGKLIPTRPKAAKRLCRLSIVANDLFQEEPTALEEQRLSSCILVAPM